MLRPNYYKPPFLLYQLVPGRFFQLGGSGGCHWETSGLEAEGDIFCSCQHLLCNTFLPNGSSLPQSDQHILDYSVSGQQVTYLIRDILFQVLNHNSLESFLWIPEAPLISKQCPFLRFH